MNTLRKIVLVCAGLLVAAWFALNFARFVSDSDSVIRLVLGALISLLILFRRKQPEDEFRAPWWVPVAAVAGGALLGVLGIVFGVEQSRWLGLLLTVGACLQWALPPRCSRDVFLSLLMLYWVHPLPARVFGELQSVMQYLSVRGAEWALQVLNVRVWADGPVLHTWTLTLAVPESCAGMKTAVTVLLFCLGIGTLFRFRWLETGVLTLLGLLQVLAFNIMRIAAMVLLAGRMSVDWAGSFLHDSLGIFLLAAVFAVQIEASLWRARRARRLARQREASAARVPDAVPRTPAGRVLRFVALILAVLAAGGAVALVGYRGRPFHRAMMIGDIIDELARRDSEAAERACAAALKLAPDDQTLKTRQVQVLLLRGKFTEALARLNGMRQQTGDLLRTTLSAWALMGLGRADESIALIRALPAETRDLPGVAIVEAEFAAMRGATDEVAANIVKAAKWNLLASRVRALFPVLASKGEWRVIARCRMPVPYASSVHAMLAVHAHLQINDPVTAGEILKEALAKWPDEPAFQSYVAKLAVSRPGGRWESLFEERLKSNLPRFAADQLAVSIDQSFAMTRPDLAWLAYSRLAELDPADPALFLAPAQFGGVWFAFRKHRVRMAAVSAEDKVDMSSWYLARRARFPVPLADELAGGNLAEKRREYVQLCLRELNNREEKGKLTARMWTMYPTVLALAGRYDEAHARLNRMEKVFPDKKSDLLFKHARLYEEQGAWDRLYETTRTPESGESGLMLDLMRIDALMHLDAGAYAFAVACNTARDWKDAPLARQALASAGFALGAYEEALFALQDGDGWLDSPLVAELLVKTERYAEAKQYARTHGMAEPKLAEKKTPAVLLPRAELAVEGQWPAPLTAAGRDLEIKRLEAGAPCGASPFILGLKRLMVDWHRNVGEGACSDPARWEAVGRDPVEKAAALTELMLLLAREKKTGGAAAVASRIVELQPESAIAWQAWIVLGRGDRDVVKKARAACPRDPEIWLASLVARARDEGPGGWVLEEIKKAAEERAFSAGTLVRAGDFMLRRGMAMAAAKAAEHAVRNGHGLMPAYVLAIRCGLAMKNRQWAVSCAMKAAETTGDPDPFYRMVAQLKSADGSMDNDTVAVLEKLMTAHPDDGKWADRIGHIYLRRGDSERAWNVFAARAAAGRRPDMPLTTQLLSAEAARRVYKIETAVGILSDAHERYPFNRAVLNNLVYTMALDPKTLPRAERLLPSLLGMWTNSVVALDTAAVVCRNSGKLDQAREYLMRANEVVNNTDPVDMQINPTAIDMDVYKGKYDDILDEKLDHFERFRIRSKREDLIPLAQTLIQNVKKRNPVR